ncbi:type 2 isopentenyl-diphosphate Delta-isomerase [Enterococcus timonensis]|uniref:type 2 isopentenyl-diphosphate Delta-isomerase n=1 Tax=Enterococcus timonensis TaxID=1852364 RepID=UPI0009F6D0A8|nr:type 2 isopentenyl-diphosphate Delta-isomerase [Enterococcus timonensis]
MNRKDEHWQLALGQNQKKHSNDFDDIRFIHENFPKINVDQVKLKTSLTENLSSSLPLYINAMTGGSLASKKYNEELSLLAKEFDIPMALGSMMAALKNPELADTYTIARAANPHGILWGNLSAGATLEQMKKAVDLIDADALQLHLNYPQELIMPEGDREFNNWLENIFQAKKIGVPIIVKETGFGMSRSTIADLMEAQVDFIDVSGTGGTNFIQIENARNSHHPYDYLADFGQSTVESLLEVPEKSVNENFKAKILASGGIRNPFDVVKAQRLGATSCGLAGALLPTLTKKGLPATIELLSSWQEQLTTIYALLNCQVAADLKETEIIFSKKLLSYQKQRGLV